MAETPKRKRNALLLFFVVIGLIVVVTVLASAGILNQYYQTVIMSISINIIFAASLNIVNGYMGEFSCGHAGFMAVGAYVSSVLSLILFTENKIIGAPLLPPESALFLFPVTILIGGVAAAFAGLLVAIPSFKTRDDYLAIITIAANYIIMTALNNLEIFGASRGLMGMKNTMRVLGNIAPISWMVLWVLIFTAVCILSIKRLMGSVMGKGISAIRYDEISAEIMSVDTNKMKLLAFMFSSGLAGVAGGLFAHMIGFINPASFNIMKSTEGMVMVYLGGMGSLSGSVLSAVFFTFLLEALRPLLVWKWVFVPLLLILLMQFRPEGLMGNKEITYFIPRIKAFFAGKPRAGKSAGKGGGK